MTTSALRQALVPQSIAILGASDQPNHRGTAFWDALRQPNPPYQLFAVNPKYDTLQGAPCYRSLTHVPEPILTVLSTPSPQRVLSTLANLPSSCQLLVLCDEYPQLWNLPIYRELLAQIRQQNTRILGPGSWGYMIPGAKLNLSVWPTLPKPGNIALFTYAGDIADIVLNRLSSSGQGFSIVATLGQTRDISMSELIHTQAVERNTKVIALQLASPLAEPRNLLKAIRDTVTRKTIIVFTGLLSQDEQQLLTPALKALGAHVCDDVDGFIDSITVLAGNRLPKQNHLAILTTSETLAELGLQNATKERIPLARLCESTVKTLRNNALTISFNNPIISRSLDNAIKSLPVLLQDESLDALLLVLHTPSSSKDTSKLLQHFVKLAIGCTKPILCCCLNVSLYEQLAALLQKSSNVSLSLFPSLERALVAFDRIVTQRYLKVQHQLIPQSRPSLVNTARIATLREHIKEHLAQDRFVLSAPETLTFLSNASLPLARAQIGHSLEECIDLLNSAKGPMRVRLLAQGYEESFPELLVTDSQDFEKLWHQALEHIHRQQEQAAPLQAVIFSDRSCELTSVRDLNISFYHQLGLGKVCAIESAEGTLLYSCFLPLSYNSLLHHFAKHPYWQALTPTVKEKLADSLCTLSDFLCAIPAVSRLHLPIRVTANHLFPSLPCMRLSAQNLQNDADFSHLLFAAPPLEEWTQQQTPKGSLFLRPLFESDFDRLARFLRRLSDKSRYLRFHTRSQLTDKQILDSFTYNPGDGQVWVLCDEHEIHALASWSRLDQSEQAEFGIVVEDAWQRAGLATVLMNKLVTHSKRHGITSLVGFVLKGNEGMQNFLHRQGFVRTPTHTPDTETWLYTIP